jgi:hypothetical protein
MERVRLTVEGTSLEAFTDVDGNYLLAQVPAGTVRLKAFYTGRATSVDQVVVTAGQTTQHNIRLAAAGRGRPGGGALPWRVAEFDAGRQTGLEAARRSAAEVEP